MSDNEKQGVCPVDHSTREAWLKQSSKQREFQDQQIEKISAPDTSSSAADKCPVDHSSREVWLQQAKSLPTSNGGESFEENCSSDRLDSSISQTSISQISSETGLSTEREISTIPRSTNVGGNWVYPSQAQFFNAMKRKNWDPNATDMAAVVPIHNAVNERAWSEILKWESSFTQSRQPACGSPNLVKFSGDASKITPKARFNMTFLGFQKPFDRHDWLIERCSNEKEQIEYVIDFYTGKPNPLLPDMPSFYLDVRPKLNSFEGCKMRFLKFIGLY